METVDPVALAIEIVANALRDTLSKLATQVGSAAESIINDKLKAMKKGEVIGPLTVLEKGKGTIVFQLRGTWNIFGVSTWIRARAAMADQIHLTSGGPVISALVVQSFMADLKVTKEGLYEASLGYGFDLGNGKPDKPAYVVGRGILDLAGGIRLDLFLGGLSKDGIAVALSVGAGGGDRTNKFPVRIPLGATGLALTGIGGSFAHNFEPILNVNGPDPAKPTAQNYVSWARRTRNDQELDIWRAASASGPYRGGLGLKCDLVTLDGFLVRLKDVGFGFLSYGPVIIFGGRGIFMSSDAMTIDALACIEFRSGSLDIAAGAQIRIPATGQYPIIEAQGGMEIFISTQNASRSFYNLGSDVSPIRGKLLTDLVQADVYFMLNLQRIKTGGGLRFASHLKAGPFALEVFFGVTGYALLGWNPVQIGAGFGVYGGVRACFKKWCLGLELRGEIDFVLPTPRRFTLTVTIKLSLPWPLPDVKWSGKIIDLTDQNPVPPQLAAPLLLVSGGSPGGAVSTSFGAVHARSGRQWKLDEPGPPARVWPDIDLVLPFNRRVTDMTGIVHGPVVGQQQEGGFAVSHRLTKLRVVRLLPSGQEVDVPNLRAQWVVGPGGDLPALHVPCENPFEWLTPYTTAEEASYETPAALIEQDFGGGEADLNIAAPRQFGSVVIDPRATVTPFSLSYLPATSLETRFVETPRVTIAIQSIEATPQPIFVSELQLVLAASEPSFAHLVVPAGFTASAATEIGALGGGQFLYVLTIKRTDGRDFNQLRIESNATFNCQNGDNPSAERVRCEKALLIHRVRWLRAAHSTTTWEERTILARGKYRVDVEGESTAFGYGMSPRQTWPRYTRHFEVKYPEQLRPYIHFATFGDSRIFGDSPVSWNPTPFGRGFPAYLRDRATVRFNAPYMSKIFPKLKVGFEDNLKTDVVPAKNTIGESYLPESALKWRVDHGQPQPNDEEIAVSLPQSPGLSHVRIAYDDVDQTPVVETVLDEWSFERSRFAGPTDHLKPAAEAIIKGYTASGPTSFRPMPWPGGSEPTTPPVHPGLVLQDWEVPQAVEALVNTVRPASSLEFLQLADRLGVRFGYEASSPLVGIIEPPRETAIEVVNDRAGRPFGLLVRTPEPLDWRRVRVAEWTVFGAVLGQSTTVFSADPPLAFLGRIVPNFDGTQAFVFAHVDSAGGKLVRLPNGAYLLRLTFDRKVTELPTLSALDTGKPDTATIVYRFVYLNGSAWPYSSITK